MTQERVYEDGNDLIEDRANWLRIDVQENHHGSWDVVIRIDGSYATDDMAEEMAEYFERVIGEMLARTVRSSPTDWWAE